MQLEQFNESKWHYHISSCLYSNIPSISPSILPVQTACGAVLRFETNRRIRRDHANNISSRLTIMWLNALNIKRRLPGSKTMTSTLMGGLHRCKGHLWVCLCDKEGKQGCQYKKALTLTVFLYWTLLFSYSPIVFSCLSAFLSLFRLFLPYQVAGPQHLPCWQNPTCSSQQRLSSLPMSNRTSFI